jgi:hypothetical protein
MTMLLADPRVFDRELAGAGALGRAYGELWRSLWAQQHLPAALLEKCLGRMATLHGLASLPVEAASPTEAAAIEFTELYAQDPAAITDFAAEQLKLYFGDAGLVALVEALGFFDARLRLARLLPQLPVRVQ